MTRGTKIFRVIVCTLLGLTILCGAFMSMMFLLFISRDYMGASYGITVAGVDVTRNNADDVLGDGTVSYNAVANVLTLQNAEIKSDTSIIYSKTDLMIELVGENKLVLAGDGIVAIHASNYVLSQYLAIFGDGSLTIEYEETDAGKLTSNAGIMARDLRIESDVTITLPDCSDIVNGIYCEASLVVSNGATVTVNNGAGKYSTAVKTRGNLDVEHGSTLNASVRPGSTELCRGINVGASMTVWEDATVNVSVDDEAANMSKCISVPGLLSIRDRAKVTASAKQTYGIECFGAMELNEDADVSASTESASVDLLCYGAIVNYGAAVNGDVDAIGGIHQK